MTPDIAAAARQIHPLVATLRDAPDWNVAVNQVADQVEQYEADDARALLLVALLGLAGATPATRNEDEQ